MIETPLPPGPRGLPLLGSAHCLIKDTHLAIDRIAQQHGDVCLMRIGQIPTVVISHPAILREAFNKPEFSDRQVSRSVAALTGRQSVAATEYGELWTQIQEALQRALSQQKAGAAMSDTRIANALQQMLGKITRRAETGEPVNVFPLIDDAIWDLSFAMVFGDEPSEPSEYRSLKGALRQDTLWRLQTSTQLGLGDLIPALSFVPDPGVRKARRLREASHNTLSTLSEIVRRRHSVGQAEPSCIMEAMLEPGNALPQAAIEATCAELLVAANPMSPVLKWWLTILANRPEVQRAVREELESHAEADACLPDAADLTYTASCFDETMRYRTTAALAVPHRTTADAELGGFRIPKGAQILANIHGIHHDQRFWTEPYTYRPDRFLTQGHSTPRPEAFMPFGVGIRTCTGAQLAHQIAWTLGIQMVRLLTFSPPGNQPLSESEVFGLTVSPTDQMLEVGVNQK